MPEGGTELSGQWRWEWWGACPLRQTESRRAFPYTYCMPSASEMCFLPTTQPSKILASSLDKKNQAGTKTNSNIVVFFPWWLSSLFSSFFLSSLPAFVLSFCKFQNPSNLPSRLGHPWRERWSPSKKNLAYLNSETPLPPFRPSQRFCKHLPPDVLLLSYLPGTQTLHQAWQASSSCTTNREGSMTMLFKRIHGIHLRGSFVTLVRPGSNLSRTTWKDPWLQRWMSCNNITRSGTVLFLAISLSLICKLSSFHTYFALIKVVLLLPVLEGH